MPASLSDEEFRLFREWLSEEFGLCFGPERRDILRNRLEARRSALGFDTFEQLYFHLKFHPERDAERERLIPHLTNNESYFFRERGQLEVLRDEVLPTLRKRLKAERRDTLHVLSAACAAGEEAYTLAIVVRESGTFPPRQLRITGIDLDPDALRRAQAGRYGRHAFRGMEPGVVEKHFRPLDDAWLIEDSLREAVAFHPGNLVSGKGFGDLPPQDVIFCRNVLIYFDREATRRAAETLYRTLVPGGYLFLGHAESLRNTPIPLRAERRPGAIFYRRPEAE